MIIEKLWGVGESYRTGGMQICDNMDEMNICNWELVISENLSSYIEGFYVNTWRCDFSFDV